MNITQQQLKQIIKEEIQAALKEDMQDPNCIKSIQAVKSDGYYPLKSATFYNAEGEALMVFQRNEDLKPGWYFNETKADNKELLAAAFNCLKTKCPKGSKVIIKSDSNIKMMAASSLTEEDFKKAFIMCN
jgi:hypothetical protein